MQIGETITNGTDDRILFQDNGVLAQSSKLLFDGTDLIVTDGGSNQFKVHAETGGTVTLDAIGSTPKFVFSEDVEVPDEIYGSGWNGSIEVPTKNAVYDITEVLIGNRILRSRYASLAAALADANGKQLVITSQETISADLDTTSYNAQIVLEGDGSFSVNQNVTLTLGAGFEASEKRVFFGQGTVKVKKSEIRLIWWSGQGNATIDTNHWTGMLGSLTLMGGGTLVVPFGRYFTAGGHNIPDSSTVKGAGKYPDALKGTVFELTSDNLAVFVVNGSQRSVRFEDFACDLSFVNGGVGVELSGARPNSTFQVGFNRVGFYRGIVGIDLVDEGNNWEMVGVNVTHCDFLYQTVANIRSGTGNNSFYLEQNIMNPASNGTADGFQGNYVAALTAVNNTILGTNATPSAKHKNFTTVSDINDTITVSSHPFTNGDAARLYTTGTLPGGLQTGTTYYVRSVDANTISLHTSYADASGNTGKINITSAAGSGTHTIRDVTAIHSDFAPADVNTSNDQITVWAHGLPTSTPSAVLVQSTGSLPTGLATQTNYYARAVDANIITLHLTASDAQAGTNAINLTSQGSGTHTLRTTLPITLERPRAAFNITNSHSVVTVINNQMEGLAYFLKISGAYDQSMPITLIGNIMQGLCKISSSSTIVSIGNNMPARSVQDEYVGGVWADVLFYSFGDQVYFDYDTEVNSPIDAGGTPVSGELVRVHEFGSSGSRLNPSDVVLNSNFFLKHGQSRSKIGFHEDGSQNAIWLTPHSPANLAQPGYFKVFNDTNASNEDLYFQFVPESGGETKFDSWQEPMAFSVSTGGGRVEGFRLDAGANPIFAKPILPASSSDSAAVNNTIYYSTTQSKLVYKDSGGTVHVLY